jgi:beta-lactam-binding protein with PASTA domain
MTQDENAHEKDTREQEEVPVPPVDSEEVVAAPQDTSERHSLQDRFEWLLKTGLLVFILAAAAFLSAILTIRIAIRGRIVEVPNVVGQESRTAQKILADRGLTMRIADRIYSDLPTDRVVRQVPAAGGQVKVDQQAHVVLSLGARRAAIPLLEGRSLRAARIELLRSGLQAGEISAAYLPEADEEMVLAQDPRPGANAASPHINFLVSQGAREPAYVMPMLMGLSQSDAQARLFSVGLRSNKLSFVPSTDGVHGTVLLQSPLPGARVSATSAIELKVAE